MWRYLLTKKLKERGKETFQGTVIHSHRVIGRPWKSDNFFFFFGIWCTSIHTLFFQAISRYGVYCIESLKKADQRGFPRCWALLPPSEIKGISKHQSWTNSNPLAQNIPPMFGCWCFENIAPMFARNIYQMYSQQTHTGQY